VIKHSLTATIVVESTIKVGFIEHLREIMKINSVIFSAAFYEEYRAQNVT